MKKTFFGLLYSLIPIIIYFLVAIIFGGDHRWVLPITLAGIFIYFSFISSKFAFWKYGVLIISPIFLLFLITSIFAGFNLLFLYLIFVPISAYLGYLFYRNKNYFIILIAFILFPLLGYYVLPNQIVLFNNSSARTIKNFKGITLINKEKDTIILNKNKIIALDFWTTSCGICFKKFPDFERIYLNLKNNPDVEMYSVNIPLQRDKFENTINLVDSLDYKFPTLFATSIEEAENLGIRAYPHLIILKDGKIHYDGRLETEKTIFISNLENEIERLIE